MGLLQRQGVGGILPRTACLADGARMTSCHPLRNSQSRHYVLTLCPDRPREVRRNWGVVKELLCQVPEFGERISLCYEAGSCGCGLWRELTALGHHCMVAAPSLIPRRADDRVKMDRRDALSLSHLQRAGEFVAVRVPSSGDEVALDLARAGEDIVAARFRACKAPPCATVTHPS